MAQHIYAIGEAVALRPHWGGVASKITGACLVRARLPPLGDSFQYRIKCEGEPYERIVLEHDLVRPASLASIAAAFVK
jgi:hypothetical protein